jgi:hypothetical protein
VAARARRARVEVHLAPGEVEAVDLGEDDADVVVALEDRPQRMATSAAESAPVATW